MEKLLRRTEDGKELTRVSVLMDKGGTLSDPFHGSYSLRRLPLISIRGHLGVGFAITFC